MTESKPGDQNILPLLCRIEPIFSLKFQDSLTPPFEQVLLMEAVIQKILKDKGVSYTLYTDCDLMGMDVTGADSTKV